MNEISQYIPFLIPIAVIEVILAVVAVVHILKHKKFKFGNTVVWLIVVIAIQIIGPILYFTIGRSDD